MRPDIGELLLWRLYLWRSGQLTRAAVVLFAQRPLEWMPNLALRLVVYGAGKEGPLGNDTFLAGPAIKVLRQVIDNHRQRTGYSADFDAAKLERQERPVYALFALREGLVNAIVHRDYTLPGGDVRVELHPGRLVISNPGRLPEGWTEANLRSEHTSNPVNHDIARLFNLRGLMEQLGMGTRKLIAACEALGAPTPKWGLEPNRVSLTLFRAPEAQWEEVLLERQAKFLGELPNGARFKVTEYARRLGLSERQARRDLALLEEQGVLERLGRGPATVYRRAPRPGQ